MEKMSLNSQFYFLKRAMKILLPVSVFSLVFSQSYSLLPSLVHSFNDFSSYFSIQLFTYSSERNYIFLLCNGILVFIIKNSGLISINMPDYHCPKEIQKELFKSSESKNEETKTVFPEKVVEIEKKGEEELQEQSETMSEDNLATVETHEAYHEDDVKIVEELEEEEEELEETLEELHKKCDDFIRRIKKEINGKN